MSTFKRLAALYGWDIENISENVAMFRLLVTTAPERLISAMSKTGYVIMLPGVSIEVSEESTRFCFRQEGDHGAAGPELSFDQALEAVKESNITAEEALECWLDWSEKALSAATNR